MKRLLFHAVRMFVLIVATTCLMGAMSGRLDTPVAWSVRPKTASVSGSARIQVTNNDVLTTAVFGFGKKNSSGVFVAENQKNCAIVLVMKMGGTRLYTCTADLSPPAVAAPNPPQWIGSHWQLLFGYDPDYIANLDIADSSGGPVQYTDTINHTVTQW